MAETKSIRDRMRELVRETRDTRKALYSTALSLVPAFRPGFPHLDWRMYDDVASWLTTEGFWCLGDYVNTRFDRVFPDCRTVERFFAASDGNMVAHFWHSRPAGRTRQIQLDFGKVAQHRCLVLQTEFRDGTFLVTANMRGLGSGIHFPGTIEQGLSPQAPFPSMLKLHRATLAQRLEAESHPPVVPARTWEEVLASESRVDELIASHYRQIGYLDEVQDLQRWRKYFTGAVCRILADEIAALKAAEAIASATGEPPET